MDPSPAEFRLPDFDRLLSVAEDLRSGYRRALAGYVAMLALTGLFILVGLVYLRSVYVSQMKDEFFRDPFLIAIVGLLVAIPAGLLYLSFLLRVQGVRDRESFYEVAQTLHEFVGIAEGRWPELQRVAVRIRLSRLEIGRSRRHG
jgi:hypothetical protein